MKMISNCHFIKLLQFNGDQEGHILNSCGHLLPFNLDRKIYPILIASANLRLSRSLWNLALLLKLLQVNHTLSTKPKSFPCYRDISFAAD